MKILIQVSVKDSAKAWGILVRHSPGMALRGRKFIVSEDAARALKKNRVRLKEISREGELLVAGRLNGERV